MKQLMKPHIKSFAFVAGSCIVLCGCSEWGNVEAISAETIGSLQASGQVLPFGTLNSAVIATHPGSQVEHAALDKIGDRYLYQASVTDLNKMQWFVELDAKTGGVVSDKQDAH